jgi:ankyrin repeat domain-containing protein 50
METSNKGHLDVSRFLCDSGADVNAADDDGWTALMWACAGGHLDFSRFLCESGADVNAAANYGWTALMSASKGGHLAVVRCLTEQGADLFARHQDGRTALALAIQFHRIAVVAYLKAEGNWQRRRSYAFVLRSIKNDVSSGRALLEVLQSEDMKREIGSFL